LRQKISCVIFDIVEELLMVSNLLWVKKRKAFYPFSECQLASRRAVRLIRMSATLMLQQCRAKNQSVILRLRAFCALPLCRCVARCPAELPRCVARGWLPWWIRSERTADWTIWTSPWGWTERSTSSIHSEFTPFLISLHKLCSRAQGAVPCPVQQH